MQVFSHAFSDCLLLCCAGLLSHVSISNTHPRLSSGEGGRRDLTNPPYKTCYLHHPHRTNPKRTMLLLARHERL